jgi:hypothetical protein
MTENHQEQTAMSEKVETANVDPVPHQPIDDGVSETAAEGSKRRIRGALVKFNKGQWTRDKQPWVPGDLKFLVDGFFSQYELWLDSQLIAGRQRDEHGRWPERETLGYTDQSQWPIGLDKKPADPWGQGPTRYLYLIQEKSLDELTLIIRSMFGGRNFVQLAGKIENQRKYRPLAQAVINLKAGFGTSKTWGAVPAPEFGIVGWIGGTSIPSKPMLPPVSMAEELSDELPF